MKLNYSKILRNNMMNVLKDVLLNIEKNGLKEGHLIYITFETNNPNYVTTRKQDANEEKVKWWMKFDNVKDYQVNQRPRSAGENKKDEEELPLNDEKKTNQKIYDKFKLS